MSVHFNAPLTKNSTRVTPTLSFADALMTTVDFRGTSEPFAGLVIDTVGGMLSPVGSKPNPIYRSTATCQVIKETIG